MKPPATFVRWAVLVLLMSVAAAWAGPGDEPTMPAQAQRPLTPRADRAAFMRGHFGLVMAAHEALVRGQLAVASQKAKALADQPDPPDLPGSAAPYLATMRLAASRAAAAVQLEDVAAASATMLATCGDCHRAVGTMPALALPPAPTVGGQVVHMLSQQQAIDLMVQGLTVPSAWLWENGAVALERAPLRKAVSTSNQKLSKELLEAERAVHYLAARARVAGDQRSRVYVYSELAQSCATCHARLTSETDPW